MAITQKRACAECHKAKVKCVRIEGQDNCVRCERLGLKFVEHVSRQGQGTRRRKKVKTKVINKGDTVDEALAISSALCPISNRSAPVPVCPASGHMATECNGMAPLLCPSSEALNVCPVSGHGRRSSIPVPQKDEERLNAGMDSLEIEDNLMCKSITNGLGRDHFGLNYLIREWVALAFSRRSFSLLARASFIASKMRIPMDDIISNQSPFATATDSEPMEFLARDILLAKNQRQTVGYPIDLREVPWDLLESVQIDPNRTTETTRNRWIGLRWTCQGISRFWTSPLFARDFANVEEIGKVYSANSNDLEVIDLFMPKQEKGKFAQEIFNLIFVNNKPHMGCFVVKNNYKVQKRNSPELIDVNVIQTMKLIDLDSMLHYFEIQFLDRKIDHILGDKTSSVNKREHVDVYVDNVNDDPIMNDSINFTDIEMTDEMEEFLKLLSG